MDKLTAQVMALGILCVTLIVVIFISVVGGDGSKDVAVPAITGILGAIGSGAAGYVLGKGGRPDETTE